jgi:hypothetical protein
LGRGKTYEAIMAILLVKLPQSEISFDETEEFFAAGLWIEIGRYDKLTR